MLNKEFFDKHFKMHNKLVLYTKDNVKLTTSILMVVIRTLISMTVRTWQSFVNITSFLPKDMTICN